MLDRLAAILWPEGINVKKRSDDSPEEKVEASLKKALAATTPEHAGCPWDGQEEREVNTDERGYYIRGAEGS